MKILLLATGEFVFLFCFVVVFLFVFFTSRIFALFESVLFCFGRGDY